MKGEHQLPSITATSIGSWTREQIVSRLNNFGIIGIARNEVSLAVSGDFETPIRVWDT